MLPEHYNALLVDADRFEAAGNAALAARLRRCVAEAQSEAIGLTDHSWASPVGLVVARAIQHHAFNDWRAMGGQYLALRIDRKVEAPAEVDLDQLAGYECVANVPDIDPAGYDLPPMLRDVCLPWLAQTCRMIGDALAIRIHIAACGGSDVVELHLEVPEGRQRPVRHPDEGGVVTPDADGES